MCAQFTLTRCLRAVPAYDELRHDSGRSEITPVLIFALAESASLIFLRVKGASRVVFISRAVTVVPNERGKMIAAAVALYDRPVSRRFLPRFRHVTLSRIETFLLSRSPREITFSRLLLSRTANDRPVSADATAFTDFRAPVGGVSPRLSLHRESPARCRKIDEPRPTGRATRLARKSETKPIDRRRQRWRW